MADLQPLLDFQLLHFSGLTITVGHVLSAAFVTAIMWFLFGQTKRAMIRFTRHHNDVNQTSLYTLSRMVKYVFVVGGAVLILEVAGIPMQKLAIFAGALGVGLGFGLQAIFNNFLSGIILLFDRSLKIGDFVELDGDIRGTVGAISIRSTRITTNDNIDLLVPNLEFITKRVVNWTYGSDTRRIRVPFGVAYGTEKEVVKRAALEAAARVPFTMDSRPPQVWLVGFGESSVNYLLVVWLTAAAARRYTSVMAAYLWELDSTLKSHGIEIPFPQRDLHLRSVFGLRGEDALAALRDKEWAGSGGSGSPPAPVLNAAERERLSQNDARADAELG